nr:hypothetical protein [Dechloromonas sp.]
MEDDVEAEGAALARFAIDADPAPHLFDQLPVDGQHEAGAAVAAGNAAVGLGRGCEQRGLMLGRDADVADGKLQVEAFVRQFADAACADGNFAAGGEL